MVWFVYIINQWERPEERGVKGALWLAGEESCRRCRRRRCRIGGWNWLRRGRPLAQCPESPGNKDQALYMYLK